jgi:hypothetical protein
MGFECALVRTVLVVETTLVHGENVRNVMARGHLDLLDLLDLLERF